MDGDEGVDGRKDIVCYIVKDLARTYEKYMC